jgi:hypothetical protein
MATPLPTGTLEADRASLLALKDLTDYTAVNPAYSAKALIALDTAMTRAEEATLRARKTLAAARDAEIAAAREFHGAILGAKAAVIAQYGNDSPAVQAIGLKKKSEHKRPVRRGTRSDGATA